MKIGILGTGAVGQTIGTALIAKEHEVMLGSRTSNNEKAVAWTASNGNKAGNGTFADAAAFGEVIFLCLNGNGTVDALQSAEAQNFKDKVVIDLTNPLDFSTGMPPALLQHLEHGRRGSKAIAKCTCGKSIKHCYCQFDGGCEPCKQWQS
jgi:8-hydroxy-5-deazaflavin:NADPH oxidoreductase